FGQVVEHLVSEESKPFAHLWPLLVRIFGATLPGDCELSEFDVAVVTVLAGNAPMEFEELEAEVLALLDPDELARVPGFSFKDRITLLGPAVANDEGRYTLPASRVAGTNDKRIRRLQTMRSILEEYGPSHYSFVAEEMARRLPEEHCLDSRGVHSWFSRYTGIFVWSGQGTYGLKNQDVGIRAEQELTALDGAYRAQSSRRKGIGDEIAAFLSETGSASLTTVEEHILNRFSVQAGSVYAAIMQDRAKRFQMDDQRVVSLRPG
ncbi:MAG: hypothetical protein M3Y37_05235, partial [Chloroflexota bacterium]|nr:hypothetical protein [Chloroflexota bacterium]